MSKVGFPSEEISSQIEHLEQRIADQATTIDSLKRALATSEKDLKTASATIRILNRAETETPRRRGLLYHGVKVGLRGQ